MALRWKCTTNHGGVEALVKSTRYARCHKCCSNPYPKVEIKCFCSKLLFFQIQSLHMQQQTIIDHRKQFLDVFMGMLGSMNDARGLRLFLIYLKVTWGNLFSDSNLHNGIKPSMIRNKGYPLLLWLMVPHKQTRARHFILETLYNK